MDTRLVAAAIPVFTVLIALEFWWSRRLGKRVYRLFDAISDLSCGTAQQLFLLFSQAPLLLAFAWVQTNYGLFEMGRSALAWLAAYLLVDFLYYWWHRASHRVNFLWAAHIVHHQSEDYNLAVALRQALITHITSWPFYLPLAFLGFDVLVFGVVLAVNTLYQFWIHTELVGKMGFWERFLNTPSHHRVHHGINQRYIDKNYAGSLITWDKLFGSWVEEDEEVVYGITKPLENYNPFWANIHYWAELFQRAKATPNWRHKLFVWIAPPEWQAEGESEVPAWPQSRSEQFKYHTVAAPAFVRYALISFAFLLAATLVLILLGPTLAWTDRLAAVIFVYGLLWSMTWGQRRASDNSSGGSGSA